MTILDRTWWLVVLTSIAGCQGCEPTLMRPDPAVADIPFDAQAPNNPATFPKAPEVAPAVVDIRHILIKYREGQQSEGVTRDEDEARRRAQRLAETARKKGVKFVALAKRFSEVPPKERGELHRVIPGEMDEAFESAAFGLGVGQVSEAVKTPFGFYVITREGVEEYSSAHILIVFEGTRLAGTGFSRSRREAKALAEQVRRKATSDEETFAVLAGRYSDSPSGKMRGGVIAPMVPQSVPEGMEAYFDALVELEEGEISEIVETPFGFHIIQRLPLQQILVKHILIAYDGAEVSPKEPRTMDQAKQLAEQVRQMSVENDGNFSQLARQYSDDHTSHDGFLPPFARGQMTPRFEQFAFGLKPGEISSLVDTRFGYHIIKRIR